MSKEEVIRVLKELRISGEHYLSEDEHDILRAAIECLKGSSYQSPDCKSEIIEGLNNFRMDEMLLSHNEDEAIIKATNYIFESMKGEK